MNPLVIGFNDVLDILQRVFWLVPSHRPVSWHSAIITCKSVFIVNKLTILCRFNHFRFCRRTVGHLKINELCIFQKPDLKQNVRF